MIRPAQAADIDALAGLDAEVFGAEAWSRRAFADALASPSTAVLLVHDGDGLVGYVALVIAGDQADLASLAVVPARQRCGWGSRLLDAAMARAWEEGAREMFLEVRTSNAAAQTLYRSRGFCGQGVRRDYYRHPREDAVCMRARLHGASEQPARQADMTHATDLFNETVAN